jgi:hypothetical protein
VTQHPRRRRARLVALGCVAGLAMSGAALASPAVAEDPLAPVTSSLTVPEGVSQIVRVSTPEPADRDRLTGLGLDMTEHGGPGFVEVLLHSPADADLLRAAGLSWTVEVPDVGVAWARSNSVTAAYAAVTDVSPLPSGRDSYRSLADYEADLDRLAAEHPGVVKPLTLPHPTLEGRQVRGVEITQDVAAADGKPVFLMMGLHHAREWPSGEHAIEFAFDLAKGFGTDERITGLLQQARVIVVPVVNPDGFDQSYEQGQFVDLREVDQGGTVAILGTPGNAYKRKNCRLGDGITSTPPGVCSTPSPGGYGIGVDLNRNYGGFWGGPGAEAEPVGPTYRGEGPFSEPETRNVRELVSTRQVTTLITNHTFSNLVLRPPGIRAQGDTPDEAVYADLGARMTAQNGYLNQKSFELYDTTGTTEDWSYYATGGLGFTFEIGEEFHPPYPRVVDHYLGAGAYAGKGNREAYLVALENTVSPAMHSLVAGKAPAGATLTLEKSFLTPTSPVVDSTGAAGPVRQSEDRLRTSMTVPADGRYTWHVNPSTRPLLAERRQATLATGPTTLQTFTGPAPTPLVGSVDVPFTVTDAAAALLQVDLDWPLPDDMDLELYRVQSDGTLLKVGSSGGFVGEKEAVLIESAEPGDYVARVINFASAGPTYTVTAATYAAGPDEVSGGLVEAWTLTCSGPDGRVHERVDVVVDRGEGQRVDLKQCAAALAGKGRR